MRGFKIIRSLTALLLAVSMLLSLGVGAFAAETDVEVLRAEKPATKAVVDATPEGLYFGFGNSEADAQRYGEATYGGVNYDNVGSWFYQYANEPKISGGTMQFTYTGAGTTPYIRSVKNGVQLDENYTLNYTLAKGDIFKVRFKVINGNTTDVKVRCYIFNAAEAKFNVFADEITSVPNDQYIDFEVNLDGHAGKTVGALQFGLDNLNSGTTVVDYIYVGPATKAPVEVVYYEGTTELYREYVGYGMGGTYQPAGKVENETLTYYNGWQDTNGDFYSAASDIRATSAMKLTTKKDTLDPNEMMSNKYLSTGSDGADDQFSVILDAYSYGRPTAATFASPLDITLILDRSGSMAAPADTNDVITITSVAQLDAVLATLDPNTYEGYYRATGWLRRATLSGPAYANDGLHPNEGWCSWETLKYENGNWYMWVPIIPDSELSGRDLQFGIPVHVSTKMYGEWQEIHTAYQTYVDRRLVSYNKNKNNSSYKFAVADYPFQICVPRLTFAINSIEDFLKTLNESSSHLRPGEHHTVSLISYGAAVYAPGFNYRYWESGKLNRTYKVTNTDLSIECSDLDTNYNAIITTLRGSYLNGNTMTSWPMQVVAGTAKAADGYLQSGYAGTYNYLAEADENRNRVVILLTDGVPTGEYGGSLFNATTANAAIAAAGAMKADGVEVYSIGFMSGLDKTSNALTSNSTEDQNANSFLQLVSSNYPGATSMTAHGSAGKTSSQYYMTDDGTGTNLADNFAEILSYIAPGATSSLTSSLAIYDELTREFKVDASRIASVYIAPYLGDGKFGDRVLVGEHDLADPDSAFAQATEYNLRWNEETQGLTLVWTDAKYGYLRENDVVNDGCHPEYKKGYKILIELPIEVNRDNTIGGNNIITNMPNSGLYNVGENGEIITEKQKIDSNGKPVTDASGNPVMEPASIIIYKEPNANVTTDVELFAHDYFMDMDSLMKILDLQDRTATIQDIFMNLVSANIDVDNAAGESKIDHVKEIRVQIIDPISGKVICELVAPQGTTEFVVDWCVDVKDFNFMVDQTFKVTAEIVQKDTSEVDSVNVTQYPNEKSDELAPNYFSPKVAIIDYDGVISVPMQKEADETRLVYTETTDGGEYDAESGMIKYDLRKPGNPYPQLQNKDYRAFDYTFEAINPRKGASLTNGKDIVSRRLLILPANVMTYDDEVLWGAGNWNETGEYVQGVQEFDNTLRHGYDPNFENVDGDLHGSARFVTVKEGETNYDTNTLSAQFWGTGFEVLSRTSEDSGAMLVEIRRIVDYDPTSETTAEVNKDGTPAGEIYKVFLVNNYLKGETLYQIPVVQMTNLPYGAYRVNIYGYYNKAFDQNYYKRSIMTEEKAREILGLDESVDFTYIPSVSEAASVAKREAAPAATKGQYNVYVDGFRVYNTRGDLTFMENTNATHRAMNRVFQYVYSLAGEYDMVTGGTAKFVNTSDLIIDAESNVDWSADGTEGILYIAGRGNADSDDTVNTNSDGFMLNMGGKINASDPVKITINGVETEVRYPLDANNNKYEYAPASEGDYKAYIYYRVRPSKKIRFCALDKNGNETILTDTEVRKIIGGGTNLAYYDSKYDLMGPEHEIYIPAPENGSYRGIVFNVADASKVMISAKAVNGATILEAYAGNDAWTAIALSGKTEMYFEVPVVEGAVILRNVGEDIVSVCNIKMIGNNSEATPKVFVKPNTMLMAINMFDNETPILDEGVQMSHSLTLKSGITINYIAKAEQLDEYDSFYMEVVAPVFEGNEQVGTKTYRLDPIADGNRYYFVMDEMAAKQMNDMLQARIYMEKDGVTYVSRVNEYSIATYAYKQLINANASEELKAVCANLLRYGAEAQKLWNYRTDSLVDEELSAQQGAYLTNLETIELKDSMAIRNDLETPIVSWKSASLALESKIVMRFTANLASYEGKVEDLTARISFVNHEGETEVVEVKNFELLDATKKLYTVDCDAIDADELRVVVSAAIYCGETQISRTAQYSVETYAARATEELTNLCKAMMAYGDCVEAFFN